MENKELCDCGNIAIWIYMPSYKNNGNPYFCDECVPRGCTCNLKPKDGNWDNPNTDNWVQPLDKLGRKYPCVEFEYDINGFNIINEKN